MQKEERFNTCLILFLIKLRKLLEAIHEVCKTKNLFSSKIGQIINSKLWLKLDSSLIHNRNPSKAKKSD